MVKVVENPTYTNRVPALSAQQVLLCVKLIRLACKRPSAAAAARLPGHRSKTPRGSRDCDSLRFAPPRKKTGDTTSWKTPSSCHHVTQHPATPAMDPQPPGRSGDCDGVRIVAPRGKTGDKLLWNCRVDVYQSLPTPGPR